MTKAVFYEDSYLKSIEARVIGIDDGWVELDRTIFYPLGGGQPGDTGNLVTQEGESFRILDTRKGEKPGTIIHQLEDPTTLIQPGLEVILNLDWSRRYRLMRMHTCLHVMASLIPVMVTGGSVGEYKSRLDFDLGDHKLDKDQLTEQVNELIRSARSVRIESIDEAELDKKPELVRTMSVQPPRGTGKIRMVRIDEIDYQPCGGTHLANIGEIGHVTVLKIENKGKKNRRVHIQLDE